MRSATSGGAGNRHCSSFLFFAREQTMKINGIDPNTLCNECVLVLPRGEQNLVFRAVGLRDGGVKESAAFKA